MTTDEEKKEARRVAIEKAMAAKKAVAPKKKKKSKKASAPKAENEQVVASPTPPEASKKKAKTAPREKKPRKKRGKFPANAVIKILHEANPKRPNTKAYAQFEALRTFHGRTVGEFREELPKMVEKAEANAELNWCVRQKFIELSIPEEQKE